MALVSLTAVAVFDAVGPALTVALMVVPAATVYLLTDRLVVLALGAAAVGAIGSAIGVQVGFLYDLKLAGSIVTVLGLLFGLAFVLAPGRGLLAQAWRRWQQRRQFHETMLAVHLLHHEGTPEQAGRELLRDPARTPRLASPTPGGGATPSPTARPGCGGWGRVAAHAGGPTGGAWGVGPGRGVKGRVGVGIDFARIWDVLVVGAGPAGALAARELARRGRSVLLLDKSEFPRPKVCGCCLNGSALATLRGVGLGHLVAGSGGVALTRTRISVGRDSAELALPTGMALSANASTWP